MGEQFRDHYFVLIRIALLLLLEIYLILSQSVLTGASAGTLLSLALLIGMVAGKELLEPKRRIWLLGAAAVLTACIVMSLGTAFLLLGIFLCYEGLTYWKPEPPWYLLPLGLALVPGEMEGTARLMIALLLGVIYFQHDFIVESYRRQAREDTIAEQELKHNMNRREHEMREAARKSLLQAENQALEEKAELSQTLHDKLGHTINGSVYQLEAVKVLMEKEPGRARKMVQAVIEELRGKMDEIRAILRNQRPKKHELAMLQLERLCEDCRQKGVEAELVTEGSLKDVPEKCLEIILDNAYEAVSNSMKYALCSRIKISVHVFHQMVRCSISDNGIGCGKVVDGMGISGMRKRVREANGILDFETEAGFTINMLLPLQERNDGKD